MSDYSEHFDQEAWDEWVDYVEENLDEIEDEISEPFNDKDEYGYYGER